jgi:hypothetical protein
MQHIVYATCVVVAAASASAAITPISPFTGDKAEGFEAIYSPGAYPGPIPIFGGDATMDDTLSHTIVISYVWTGGGGQVLPYNGNLFSGGVAGPELITFNKGAYQFGGYFTSCGPLADGTITFYDDEGASLGSMAMDYDPTVWVWQGWESDIPFYSVEITSANVPNVSTQMDDLQVSFVPEPATFSLLVLGAGLLARRR